MRNRMGVERSRGEYTGGTAGTVKYEGVAVRKTSAEEGVLKSARKVRSDKTTAPGLILEVVESPSRSRSSI
jgi:hypothetical protein